MPSQCTEQVNCHHLKSDFVTLVTGSSPVAAIWERPSGSCTASCLLKEGQDLQKKIQRWIKICLHNSVQFLPNQSGSNWIIWSPEDEGGTHYRIQNQAMLALRKKKPWYKRKEVQITYLHDPTGIRQNDLEQQEEIDEHKQEASTRQGEGRRVHRQERSS